MKVLENVEVTTEEIDGKVLEPQATNEGPQEQVMVYDPEFDPFLPEWSKESDSDDLSEKERHQKRIEQREVLHQNRLEQIEQRLSQDGKVRPFEVYLEGNNLIDLGGRYDEYVIAKKLNLDIEIIEIPFDNRDEARNYFIRAILHQQHLNEVQRCILALKLKGTEYTEKGRKNQGTRTDLMVDSQKPFAPFNTNERLAKLAAVGTQTMNRVKVIVQDFEKPEEESYLDKEICRSFLNDMIDGKMCINQAYRKFKDAKEIKKEADNASSKENLFGEKSEGNDAISDSSNKVEFINPDLSQGIENKIVCGENLEVMKQVPTGWIDCVISSPDYNVRNIKYGDKEDLCRPYEEYLKFLDERFVEIDRVLSPNGTLILNIASVRNEFEADREKEYNSPIFSDVIQHIRDLKLGLKYRTHYIWDKGYAFAKHNFISVPKDLGTFQTHEFIIIFSKGDWFHKSNNPNAISDLTAAKNEKIGRSVWRIVPQSPSKGKHPCPFPEKLINNLVLRWTQRNSVVADFWLGTGTVTAVAAQNGRKYFGCDFVPEYCQQAKLRTEKAVAKFQKGLEARLKSQAEEIDPENPPIAA